jgi:CRP/FNR family transcriptional regulator
MKSTATNTDVLAKLSDAERLALLGLGSARKFKTGEVLLREGESGSSMILLRSGTVDVQRGGKALASVGAGSSLGEMALLDPGPRSATARATSEGELVELTRDAVWELLARGEPSAARLLQSLTATVCERLASVNGLVQNEVVAPRGGVFSRLFQSVFGR